VEQIIFSRIGNFAQFVEFGIHAFADDSAFVEQCRWIRYDFSFDAVANHGTRIQLFAHLFQADVVRCQKRFANGFDGCQGYFQLHHFARGNSSYGCFRNDSFQVADERKLLFQQFFQFRLAKEVFHHIEAIFNRFFVFQRKHDPTPQQARAHWRNGFVEHIEQTFASFVHRRNQFETANGEFVEPHVAVFFDAAQCHDVAYLRMLGDVEIMKNGSRGNDAEWQMVYAESFQIFRLKMFEESVTSGIRCKNPIVELEKEKRRTETFFEFFPTAAFDQNFFRRKIGQEFVDVVSRSLRSQKFTG
jgi:hypothetical protein